MYSLAALKHLGITQNYTEYITKFVTAPYPPDTFQSNWTQYPGNSRFDLNTIIAFYPQKLYMRVRRGEDKRGSLLQKEKMILLINSNQV